MTAFSRSSVLVFVVASLACAGCARENPTLLAPPAKQPTTSADEVRAYTVAGYVPAKLEAVTISDYGAPVRARRVSLNGGGIGSLLGPSAVLLLPDHVFMTRPYPSLAITRYPDARLRVEASEDDLRDLALMASKSGTTAVVSKVVDQSTAGCRCYRVDAGGGPLGGRICMVLIDLERRVVEVQFIARK